MRRQAVPYGEDDHGRRDYRIVACGSSPGFVSMYAMAGADLAMTERLTDKKRRLLQGLDSDSTLLLSARPLDLPSAQDALVVLGEEARILAALVALYGAEKPSREAVEAAAGYARMARLVPGGAGYEALLDGERLAAGTLADAVTLAVGALHPQSGEVLTLYYGQGLPRARVEELLPGLRAAFPSLEGLDLYYGGQSEPLILNLE